ncbi:MAG: hypothetical protein WDM85_11630 [Caulobacteraceae bacterium]
MTNSQRDTKLEADAASNGQLKTPVEARQGVKTRHVRWMLVISLSLGVVALAAPMSGTRRCSRMRQRPSGLTSVQPTARVGSTP